MRIVVVGGGIIGTCFALEARARGVEVLVVETTGLHAEASTAAAGILGAEAEAMTSGHDAAAGVRAREALIHWLPSLEARTGVSVRFARRGTLVLPASANEHAEYTQWLAGHAPSSRSLDAAEVESLQPALARPAHGAFLFDNDGSLEPARLGTAVTSALRIEQIPVYCGDSVSDFVRSGDTVCGVRLESGKTLESDLVVVAAGAWGAKLLQRAGVRDSAKPLRGQLIELRPRGGEVRPVVFEGKRYVVPRGDGRYVVGSTMEDAGFDRSTTPDARAELLAFARRISPIFHEAEEGAHWAGLRPYRDGGPRIGATPIPGLFSSFGHGRNGILHCRQSALQLADAIGI